MTDSTAGVVADLARVKGAGALAVGLLAELVRLKDGPRDAAYEDARALAWAAARALVAVVEGVPLQPVAVPDVVARVDGCTCPGGGDMHATGCGLNDLALITSSMYRERVEAAARRVEAFRLGLEAAYRLAQDDAAPAEVASCTPDFQAQLDAAHSALGGHGLDQDLAEARRRGQELGLLPTTAPHPSHREMVDAYPPGGTLGFCGRCGLLVFAARLATTAGLRPCGGPNT